MVGLLANWVSRVCCVSCHRDWVKVKNRSHPAMSRVMDGFSRPTIKALLIESWLVVSTNKSESPELMSFFVFSHQSSTDPVSLIFGRLIP